MRATAVAEHLLLRDEMVLVGEETISQIAKTLEAVGNVFCLSHCFEELCQPVAN